MRFINNTIVRKKWMAVAGVLWFAYLIFHVLSLLSFHSGESAFNDFYAWYESSFMNVLILFVLIITLVFHVWVAVDRQLDNNKKSGQAYFKSYPKIVPRFIAWFGATSLLAFILFHFVQVKIMDETDLYAQISAMLTEPVMIVIYALGFIVLGAHLHHGLTNVLQTLGLSAKQYQFVALSIVGLLILGFVSIPLSIWYG